MCDPLAQVFSLLQPKAESAKLVTAGGAWAIRRSDDGAAFYCAVLEGTCRLAVAELEPIPVGAGEFVLIPAAAEFVISSERMPSHGLKPVIVEERPGEFSVGTPDAAPKVRMMVGHGTFVSDDAALLTSLLPRFSHVRAHPRLMTLVELVGSETREERPARDLVLSRLLDVLMIEALRSDFRPDCPPGLLRGLGDERLAQALRAMHDRPAASWTVAELAKTAALSRSTFFTRFQREVGVPPMEYLLGWRMALAKSLLRERALGLAQIAERVGYSSASTFSAAFSRHVGASPSHYGRSALPRCV